MIQLLSGVSLRHNLLQPVYPKGDTGGNSILSTVSLKRNQLLVRYRPYGVEDNKVIAGMNIKPVEHQANFNFVFVQM